MKKYLLVIPGFCLLFFMACQSENTAKSTMKTEVVKMEYNDQEGIDALKALLASSDVTDINSISKLFEKVSSLTSRQKLPDQFFIDLNEFMDRAVDDFNEKFLDRYTAVQADIWRGLETDRLKNLRSVLSKNGLQLNANEGYYYAEWIPGYREEIFKDKTTEAVSAYLDIVRKEDVEGFAVDSYLLITFDKIAQRVLNWEAYLDRYPDAGTKAMADEKYRLYLRTLMGGMDNSPVCDMNDLMLLPGVEKVYQDLIRDNPNSKTAKKLKAYYDVLAKNHFVIDGKIYDYINQQKLSYYE